MDKENLNKIIKIISKNANINENSIHEDSSMETLPKWDSLAHLRIMMDIEKTYKKKISTSKMSELNSVCKIINFLNNK